MLLYCGDEESKSLVWDLRKVLSEYIYYDFICGYQQNWTLFNLRKKEEWIGKLLGRSQNLRQSRSLWVKKQGGNPRQGWALSSKSCWAICLGPWHLSDARSSKSAGLAAPPFTLQHHKYQEVGETDETPDITRGGGGGGAGGGNHFRPRCWFRLWKGMNFASLFLLIKNEISVNKGQSSGWAWGDRSPAKPWLLLNPHWRHSPHREKWFY